MTDPPYKASVTLTHDGWSLDWFALGDYIQVCHHGLGYSSQTITPEFLLSQVLRLYDMRVREQAREQDGKDDTSVPDA